MKDLQRFTNDQFGQLRVHEDENGRVWFCGKDIAAALDYSQSSTPAVLFQAVPDEWKGIKQILMWPRVKKKIAESPFWHPLFI